MFSGAKDRTSFVSFAKSLRWRRFLIAYLLYVVIFGLALNITFTTIGVDEHPAAGLVMLVGSLPLLFALFEFESRKQAVQFASGAAAAVAMYFLIRLVV